MTKDDQPASTFRSRSDGAARRQRQTDAAVISAPARGIASTDPLTARYDPGQPYLQWTCALCPAQCFAPDWLEDHTAAEHPGWTARYEILRPYPRQLLRVVYRRTADQGSGEG